MQRLLVALLFVLLAGCATTPRGNASNACNFAFLAAIPSPFGVVAGAALCTFGLELLPDDEEEDDEDEEGDGV